jgi:uncharacterized repeat protein (TIGR01451 family)
MAALMVLSTHNVAFAIPMPGAAWKISLLAEPTNLSLTHSSAGEPADQYLTVLTNTGTTPSSGPITLTDKLPAGITIARAPNSSGWVCTESEAGTLVTCRYGGVVPALGQSTVLTLPVSVAVPPGVVLTNRVIISGGGASVATASRATQAGGAVPPFGFLDFSLQASDASGAPDTRAGGHPYALTTTLDFPQREAGTPVQIPKALKIELPAGLIADPRAAQPCTIVALFAAACPPSSRVGTFFLNMAQGLFEGGGEPIYNVVPERGNAAEFGAYNPGSGKAVFMYANVGPAPEYRLEISVPDIPAAAALSSAILTFFGDPQGVDGTGNSPIALLTNPSDCSGAPLVTNIRVDTYEEPEHWVKAEASAAPVAGCDLLQFQPFITLAPETTLADEPTGYTLDLRVPQSPPDLEGLATAQPKNIAVTLLGGISISPAAADGLLACPAEGPEGIDLTSPEAGHCPLPSQVGDAEAVTPLLEAPLRGHVYLAQPGCGGAAQAACTETDAIDGNLYGLYVQLEGPGVTVKLHGTISANPAGGQLTVSFRETPQLPLSDLKLTLPGGPRALLANPRMCGEALTTSDMTPWSAPETPDAKPSFAFAITGCEGSPFSLSFQAGTTSANAGDYSDLSITFSRADRTQNLSAIQVQTPPGLSAMLSNVTLCGEPQAQQGNCSRASRIGTATAAAGAGSHPFWISGPVYLTGPYRGAPFGLAIAIPAVAGPFNLGRILTRAAVNVDPRTAALTITSDPLPQVIDGMPLRLQTVNITLDRPQLIVNPTNCDAHQITATIASAQGATANVSSPFAAGGCRNLPFSPRLTALTRSNGEFAGHGASLHVAITTPPGQANMRSLKVDLPQRLPARLETIQHACPESTFNASPAACPKASVVGQALAATPILATLMAGPAILVSHGAAFPNLVLVLQGQGVRIDLTGALYVNEQNVTSVTFRTIPDVPIRRLDLILPEGSRSILAASASLCKTNLRMSSVITAQNGARVKHTATVAVMGCRPSKKRRR